MSSVNDTVITFELCWMTSINSGLNWSQLTGCFFLLYCFVFADKKLLWNVLLAHALTGFAGILVETLFSALRCNGNSDPKLAYLLALNEINWIIYEASTVLYSYIKTRTAIRSRMTLKFFNGFMTAAFFIFIALRANIGYLRFSSNTLMNASISRAHSYAFIVWGTSDLTIFGLMIYWTWNQMQKENVFENVSLLTFNSIFTRVQEPLGKILVKSSLPRITILCVNTFSIVILAQIREPLSAIQSSFNMFVWMVKGTYPAILMLDILLTKEMLILHKTHTALDASVGANVIGADMHNSPAALCASLPRLTRSRVSSVFISPDCEKGRTSNYNQ
ncbi:hypothetical protein BC830DRAFT_1103639 [Chytriomyces sp. MP71]|nr:hypothetical protein BC830DRAFT_1103639 [Chytriomyces sp. MP71]